MKQKRWDITNTSNIIHIENEMKWNVSNIINIENEMRVILYILKMKWNEMWVIVQKDNLKYHVTR